MSMLPRSSLSAHLASLSRRRFLSGAVGTLVGIAAVRKALSSSTVAPQQQGLDTAVPDEGGGLTAYGFGRGQLLRDGSFETKHDTFDSNQDWAVALIGSPTGGTFTLTANLHGERPATTRPIPYNASAHQIRLALQALQIVGPGGAEVTAHAGLFLVTFRSAAKMPTLSGSGAGLLGGGTQEVRIDKLSAWVSGSKSPIRQANRGTHGRQNATLVAEGTRTRQWRGPLMPCSPGDVLSIGADSCRKRGNGSWTLGLVYFTSALIPIRGSGFSTPAHTDRAWGRVTGTAAAAPHGTVFAALTVQRNEDDQAADGDKLALDAVLVIRGEYTGPMLPAMIMTGDIRPDGFLLSAYGGLGCDQIRARIFHEGVEVDEISPTVPGAVEAFGWGATRAEGLRPATEYRVQLEARNRQSQRWESFGGLI